MADDAGGAPPPAPAGPPMVAPGPDISIADRFLGASISLYIVTSLLVGMRLIRQFQKSSLGAADVSAILAWMAASLQIGLLWAAILHGFGRHNFYLSIDDQITCRRLMQMSYLPWVCGVAFGKISIARLLMGLKQTSGWKATFWSVIALQVPFAIFVIVALLASCRPIQASWNPMVPGALCWDYRVFQVSVYVMGAVAVATDFIFAAISTCLLYKLNSPWHERIIVIFILNGGFFFSAFVIVKITYINKVRVGVGYELFDTVDLAIWSVVEVLLGIIAGCIPVLRSTFVCIFKRFLRRVSLITSTRRTDPSIEFHLSNLQSKSSEQGILGPTGPAC